MTGTMILVAGLAGGAFLVGTKSGRKLTRFGLVCGVLALAVVGAVALLK
jgi:hypothetical protein